MVLTVKPASFLKGKIFLPASKSYSIRAFIVAARGGHSVIIGPSNCDDAKVAIRAARFLGAQVNEIKQTGAIPRWEIIASRHPSPMVKINVKESGTVLRFLLPILASSGYKTTVTGEGTLRGRPNVFLTEALRRMGVDIKGRGDVESVPICIKNGVLKGGDIVIDGSLSSQFISAFLIACPCLPEDTRLKLVGKRIVSSDYVDMTRRVLTESGIKIHQQSAREYHIKGNQAFKGLKKFVVPSDYGLAAFLMAAAVLVESDITLTGYLKDDFIQADGHIVSLLQKMGVALRRTSRTLHIKGPCPLRGGNFSLKNCPDLVPVMSILALFAKGRTRLYDIGHARAKESDRISDLRAELLKVGAKVTERRDEMVIDPQEQYKNNCLLDPHKDHRLAMSFCVLGLKLGVRVQDIKCTHKSYPDFVKDFKALGASVREG